MIKDVNVQILRNDVEVRRRWAECLEQVLNAEDIREANINIIGDRRVPVLGDSTERAISIEEVREGSEFNEIGYGSWSG